MTCNKCTHAQPVDGGLVCTRYPPTVTAMPIPARVQPTPGNPEGRGMMMVPGPALFPSVSPETRCGEFKVQLTAAR